MGPEPKQGSNSSPPITAQGEIDGDSIDPRVKRAIPLKLIEFFKRTKKRVLQHVLRHPRRSRSVAGPLGTACPGSGRPRRRTPRSDPRDTLSRGCGRQGTGDITLASTFEVGRIGSRKGNGRIVRVAPPADRGGRYGMPASIKFILTAGDPPRESLPTKSESGIAFGRANEQVGRKGQVVHPGCVMRKCMRVNSSARATQVAAAAVQTAAVYIGLTPVYDDDHQ